MANVEEVCNALDSMHRAVHYLSTQFHINMSRRDAEANFQSRRLLIVLHNRIISENLAQLQTVRVVIRRFHS